uniref:Novel immune-type receptor 3a n=1 Tax=Sinocyclocheilus anshuiensis TaxID=1608454 RepID=A0A671KG36_9TELE
VFQCLHLTVCIYFLIVLLLFLDGTCQIKGVIHQHPLVVAELGSSVILPCSYSFDMIHTVSWYKQTVGKKPLLIAYSSHLSVSFIYQNGFDKVERYSFEVGTDFLNMSIINLKENDFANYYCAVTFFNTIQFGEGMISLHKGKDSAIGSIVLQQPVSDRLHPGDSVTLQCSVISQICAGEYSVYWFRHSSGHSHPGLIYTRDNRSDQCMEKSENGSSTQSCVFNLSQTELRPSDAGIYYCAVATCGKIHFGNGTKLIVEVENVTYFFVFMVVHENCYYFSIFDFNFLESSCFNPTESDALNYVALSFSKRLTTSKRSSGKTSQEETVYSQITNQ